MRKWLHHIAMVLLFSTVLLLTPTFADHQGVKEVKLPDEVISCNVIDAAPVAETTSLTEASLYRTIGTAKYNLVADDVLTAGMLAVNTQVASLKNMGYSTVYSYLPSALSIYNSLKSTDISIIHGHGVEGSITCENTSGLKSYLYSYNRTLGTYDATLYNYSPNSINAKLIIFTSCRSGTAPAGGTSLVAQAYNKGADLVLGYYPDVAGGEYYSDYLITSLSWGETFAEALAYADNSFTYMYSVDASVSPARAANRCIRGNQAATFT